MLEDSKSDPKPEKRPNRRNSSKIWLLISDPQSGFGHIRERIYSFFNINDFLRLSHASRASRQCVEQSSIRSNYELRCGKLVCKDFFFDHQMIRDEEKFSIFGPLPRRLCVKFTGNDRSSELSRNDRLYVGVLKTLAAKLRRLDVSFESTSYSQPGYYDAICKQLPDRFPACRYLKFTAYPNPGSNDCRLVKKFPSLTELHLIGFIAPDLQMLFGMKHLKSLTLNYHNGWSLTLDHDDQKDYPEMSRLELLNLSFPAHDHGKLPALIENLRQAGSVTRLTRLKTLIIHIMQPYQANECLDFVFHLSNQCGDSLESLQLMTGGRKLFDAIETRLQHYLNNPSSETRLQFSSLEVKSVSDKALSQLLQLFCHQLKTLIIKYNFSGQQYIADYLLGVDSEYRQSIRRLEIGHCDTDALPRDKFLVMTACMLRKLPTLESLLLWVGLKGLPRLLDYSPTLTDTLQEVTFKWKHTADDISSIFNCISGLTSLRHLIIEQLCYYYLIDKRAQSGSIRCRTFELPLKTIIPQISRCRAAHNLESLNTVTVKTYHQDSTYCYASMTHHCPQGLNYWPDLTYETDLNIMFSVAANQRCVTFTLP